MRPRYSVRHLGRLARDDRGVALITVIGASGVLAILTTAIVMVGVGNLRQAGRERLFEQALHVADSGVDHSLHRLRESNGAHATGETPPTSFASVAAERQWVLDEAAAAVAADPARLVTTPEGQWVTIVAPNAAVSGTRGVLYSVGYAPDMANPTSTRIIRAEYDFAPYSPSTAFLTNGSLTIAGNPNLGGAQANIHANGDISVAGSPIVAGSISASGTVTGVSGTSGAPRIELPSITPRENYHMSEYDLCPGGEVRAGPSFDDETLANTTDTPCQGQLIGDANGIEFRGWKRNGSDSVNGDKWSYSAATAYDGVYYVYNGTADIAGNPGSPGSPWRATVLAESTGTGGGTPDCPHLGGDISVSGNPTISYHDKAQPLLLIAGRDLRMSGNPDNPFEGIIAAHEQVQISGNPTINGSFFVQDECQTPSSLVDGTQVASISGNPTINFSGAEIPIGDTIRTTLWLEI